MSPRNVFPPPTNPPTANTTGLLYSNNICTSIIFSCPLYPSTARCSISCHRRRRDHRLENFSGVMIHVCSGISSHFSPKAFGIPRGCGIISRLIYPRYPFDRHIGMSHRVAQTFFDKVLYFMLQSSFIFFF